MTGCGPLPQVSDGGLANLSQEILARLTNAVAVALAVTFDRVMIVWPEAVTVLFGCLPALAVLGHLRSLPRRRPLHILRRPVRRP